MSFIHGYLLDLFLGALDFRRERAVGHRLDIFYFIGNKISVGYDYLPCLFLSEVIELAELSSVVRK